MNRRFVVLGVVAFLLAVVALFPARTAYNWIQPPGVQLGGISGTIWSGAATEGLAGGMYMRNVGWRLKPLALFTGKLAFATSFDPAAGFMDANVALSPGGTMTLSEVSGSVPLELLHQSIPTLRGFRGNIDLNLPTIVLEDGFPTTIQGTVTVNNVQAAALSPSPVGDYAAEFSSDENGIQGVVRDLSGVLSVNGDLTFTRDRAYSLVGQVALRPDAPLSLARQIEMLGSPDAQGNREFRIEGQL